jgi:hypothetical protein
MIPTPRTPKTRAAPTRRLLRKIFPTTANPKVEERIIDRMVFILIPFQTDLNLSDSFQVSWKRK